MQAGLRSLHAGGITPRTLIIDDGWQMTQVDEDHEGARKVSKKRPIFGLSGFRDEPDKSFSESRDEEFAESEQAVLAAYADALPGGAELMNTMPALSDPGAPHHGDSSACSHVLHTLRALGVLQQVCCPYTFADLGRDAHIATRRRAARTAWPERCRAPQTTPPRCASTCAAATRTATPRQKSFSRASTA